MEYRGWRAREDRDKMKREREERDVEYRGRRLREDKDERHNEMEERNLEYRGRRVRKYNDKRDKKSVPNELIGSVIGEGGGKIAEIWMMSGERIKISGEGDPDESPPGMR